ncbi:unnamed protein product, partial [marine sediment metagenome]
VDLTMYILENSTLLKETYLSHYGVSNLEELRQRISSLNEQAQKQTADKTIQNLVKKHSFNTVVDTAIHIIDSKLPEAEGTEVETIEPSEAKLTPELARRTGEREICLEILLQDKTPEDLILEGFPGEKVRETVQIYLSKQADGSYALKDVGNAAEIQQAEQTARQYVEQNRLQEIEAKEVELARNYLLHLKDNSPLEYNTKITNAEKAILQALGQIPQTGAMLKDRDQIFNQAAKELVQQESDKYRQSAIEELRNINAEFGQEYNTKLREQYVSEKDM